MWLTTLLFYAGVAQPIAPPQLSAYQVVNAASFLPGAVAPGELVVLFAAGAGPEVMAHAQLDRQGKAITVLDDTRVWFDGIAAPLAYAARGQICVVAPYELAGRETTEVAVEYRGLRSPPVRLPVVRTAPALFTLNSSGKGQAGMLNEMGCCNSPRNPAMRGSIVALYATGEGQTSPAGIDGRVIPYVTLGALPRPRLPVKVTLGGVPAEVVFAGAAPNMVSMMQVNIRVPTDAPVGDAVPLVLTVGQNSSPASATMAVRSREQMVLVVEPDAARRNRLMDILSGAGYTVLASRSRRDALTQTREHPIDLAIFSLAEPETERLAAVREMQALRPLLKIVATAEKESTGSLRAADIIGSQALLTAPLNAESVRPRVSELLRSHPVPYETSH
jgi:uncharacterized protein (TIGR03437 family)